MVVRPRVDYVGLVTATFQGLKECMIVVASVATIYFQAQMSTKQDLSLAKQEVAIANQKVMATKQEVIEDKQDLAARKTEEVKRALDKTMEPVR